MGAFSDMCSAWARESKARMTAVYRTAAEDMVEEVSKIVAEGGHLPFKTGNLRRSLMASTTAMPLQGEPKAEYAEQNVSAIMSATLEDTIHLGFQANYARRMNYGFVGADSLGREYDQRGYHFVEEAVAKWPAIVAAAAARVEAGVAARKASG